MDPNANPQSPQDNNPIPVDQSTPPSTPEQDLNVPTAPVNQAPETPVTPPVPDALPITNSTPGAYSAQSYSTPPTASTEPLQPAQDPMSTPSQTPSAFPANDQASLGGSASPETQPGKPGLQKFLKPTLLVVIVIILGIGGYFGYKSLSNTVNKNKTTNETNKAVASSNAKAGVPQINTLGSFSFVTPATSQLDGLTQSQSSSTMDQLASSDGVCTVAYGTETQSQLPGSDIGDVIGNYISKLKQQYSGLQVTGPTNANDLVLKASNGKSYYLPTVDFTYSESGSQGGVIAASYSISELSNQDHAVVAAFCGSSSGSMSTFTQRLNALQPVLQAITIKTS
jgi:hypothetical protein